MVVAVANHFTLHKERACLCQGYNHVMPSMGIESATLRSPAQRSNQLSYAATKFINLFETNSNSEMLDHQKMIIVEKTRLFWGKNLSLKNSAK